MSRLLRKSLSSKLRRVQFNRQQEAFNQKRESRLALTGELATTSELAAAGELAATVDGVGSSISTVAIAPNQPIYQVAIILPVYNEQACISPTYEAVLAYCQSHPDYCFIFVNDGSSDRTQQILEQRIADSQTEQIQLVSYGDRGGKGYAVRMGVYLADAEYVCFLDGDLAYSLDHLDRLVAKLAQFDVVIGCRSLMPEGNQGLKLSRKIAGKIFNALSKQILNLPYVDMQAGLKGFRVKAAKEIFDRQELMGFSFDVELIYLAKKLSCSIAEIPAYVSSSHATKISKVNLLADSFKMLCDLFKIRWNDWMGRYG